MYAGTPRFCSFSLTIPPTGYINSLFSMYVSVSTHVLAMLNAVPQAQLTTCTRWLRDIRERGPPGASPDPQDRRAPTEYWPFARPPSAAQCTEHYQGALLSSDSPPYQSNPLDRRTIRPIASTFPQTLRRKRYWTESRCARALLGHRTIALISIAGAEKCIGREHADLAKESCDTFESSVNLNGPATSSSPRLGVSCLAVFKVLL